jgi:AcrR family transcriptional regulator
MSTEPPDTIVERKQTSRRRLLNAARELFVARGYHQTRPQDIARAAGVGHGTFYLHFADKRDCFFAFMEEAAHEAGDVVYEHTKDTTTLEGFIRGIMMGCDAYSAANPGVLDVAMIEPHLIDPKNEKQVVPLTVRWSEAIAERMREMADQGLISRDLDPMVLGFILAGALAQAARGGRFNDIATEELLKTVVPFVSRALAPLNGG